MGDFQLFYFVSNFFFCLFNISIDLRKFTVCFFFGNLTAFQVTLQLFHLTFQIHLMGLKILNHSLQSLQTSSRMFDFPTLRIHDVVLSIDSLFIALDGLVVFLHLSFFLLRFLPKSLTVLFGRTMFGTSFFDAVTTFQSILYTNLVGKLCMKISHMSRQSFLVIMSIKEYPQERKLFLWSNRQNSTMNMWVSLVKMHYKSSYVFFTIFFTHKPISIFRPILNLRHTFQLGIVSSLLPIYILVSKRQVAHDLSVSSQNKISNSLKVRPFALIYQRQVWVFYSTSLQVLCNPLGY